MKIISGGLTDIGKKREKNEDSFSIIDLSEKLSIPTKCFAVADGVGGNLSGDIASNNAVVHFEKLVSQDEFWSGQIEKSLKDCIRKINSFVYSKKSENENYRDMCTTLTTLLLYNRKYFVGHVGDSRIYLYRNGKMNQITRDHTAIQDAIDNGELTLQEAILHPNKSIITRAVGFKDKVEIDITKGIIKENDVFVLCSDGLSGLVDEERIKRSLDKYSNPQKICKELVKKANNAGGIDNITVIVVKIVESTKGLRELLSFLPFKHNNSQNEEEKRAPSTIF